MLSEFIAQDICYACTNGKWMLPKHVHLGTSVKHITGSAQSVQILNKFGHCPSNSFLLELETARYDEIQKSKTILPPSIDKSSKGVLHTVFDNFDLLEETSSGFGTTHSTHGIVIHTPGITPQDETIHCQSSADSSSHASNVSTSQNSLETPSTSSETSLTFPAGSFSEDRLLTFRDPKNKKRSVKTKPLDLSPCFVKKHSSPLLNDQQTCSFTLQDTFKEYDFRWVFLRVNFPLRFPAWKGWLSVNAEPNVRKQSTIDYLPPIMASITENSTVQEVLRIAQKATEEFGQIVTLITFDLAAAKKAYNIIWQEPTKYDNVSVHLGAFHILLSYFGALGKSMRGTGIEDILIESGVCASGSIDGVLKGKQFNRAMMVHTTILEAFERLLFKSFEEKNGQHVRDLISKSKSTLDLNPSDTGSQDEDEDPFSELSQYYHIYKEKVRSGKYGRTAQFFLQYMDRVWNVLKLDESVRANDLDQYIHCLSKLCPLFFTMDHQNYARYLSFYVSKLRKMTSEETTLLREGGFSAGRSNIPNSREPNDKCMEETGIRHAKTKGGIIGFSRNIDAYYRWSMTRHWKASMVESTREMLGMTERKNGVHKDLGLARMREGEVRVEKVMSAVSGFINPFDTVEDLVCLSSGVKLPDDVATALVQLESKGKQLFDDFTQKRLVAKTVDFNDSIKRNNVKTFAYLSQTTTVTSSAKKSFTIKAQRDIFGQLLVKAQDNKIDLFKVMSYQLSPVPYSLATGGGFFMTTNKATLMHKLENKDILESYDTNSKITNIIDGNALLQSLVGLPETFGDLALKVFNLLPKNSDEIHFITDAYDSDSIKGLERTKRGNSKTNKGKDPLTGGGPLTKLPREWKNYLSFDENKTNLMQFILGEWESDSYAHLLKGKKIFFVCEKNCTLLSSENGRDTDIQPINELVCDQEEADTRIILHCMYISKIEDSCPEKIIVRSPDTDVFLLLLAFDSQIKPTVIFDTGMGDKRRLLNISKLNNMLPNPLCQSLLGFHSLTGCDTTSCFAGKGKIRPLNLMKKHEDIMASVSTLGDKKTVDADVVKTLEQFVCRIYGSKKEFDINRLRASIVKKKFSPGDNRPIANCKGIDLSQLPPCRTSLIKHIQRANFQARIWKHAHKTNQDLPQKENSGWKRVEGELVVDWNDEDIFPIDIIDIIAEDPCIVAQSNDASNENDDLGEDDNDYVVEEEWFSETEDEMTDSDSDSDFEDDM